MNSRTQKLANSFPIWTKVRRDPSSFGQRWLSVAAEPLSEIAAISKKISDNGLLLRAHGEPAHLWFINLTDADQLISTGHPPKITYPSVSATLGSSSSQTRYDFLSDLLSAPTNYYVFSEMLSRGDEVIWDSDTEWTYGVIEAPCRLYISISDSTNFYKRTGAFNQDKSGLHRLVVIGLDENNNSIREVLDIPDDGSYISQNYFSSVTEIFKEGFDGRVLIHSQPSSLTYKVDPFRSIVETDNEGPLLARLEGTSLVLETVRLKSGLDYRKPGISDFENIETFCKINLVSVSEAPITPVDFVFNSVNGHLYVADANAIIYCFRFELPAFETQYWQETEESYLELNVLPYVAMGSTEKVFTYFSRMRFPISSAKIIRRDPTNTIEYLQSDLTWDAASYSFAGTGSTKTEDSWKDFNFDVEFDIHGQWDFCIEVLSGETTTRYVTSTIVPKLTAATQVDLTPTGVESMDIDAAGRLVLWHGSAISKYNMYPKGYVADFTSQKLFFAAPFTSITVT